MSSTLEIKICNLKELLSEVFLKIPSYQRPYTWKTDQVGPLLRDLFTAESDSILILGTLILFVNSDNEIEIVDGQQRLITLSIFCSLIREELDNQFLIRKFSHSETVRNITSNARYINDFMRKKGNNSFKIPIEQILFIVVFAPTVEEAFTFFDSQNNRGKPLADTDILKAHHLRFIKEDDLAANCAEGWELIQKDKTVGLDLLLETILGRGRKFSRNETGEINIKKEFKSQRAEDSQPDHYHISRYQQSPIFRKWTFDATGDKSLELFFEATGLVWSKDSLIISNDAVKYLPFQATQSIEGGELFFWFTQKYYTLYGEVFDKANIQTSTFFKDLQVLLKDFTNNTGANYVHGVYIGSLLFYIDKFGYEKLDQVASHLFFSVYWLRFKQSAVQYSSIFKFVREEFNPFSLITNSGFPGYVLSTINDYLEGKYSDLRQSKGIRRDMFDLIVKPWEPGFYTDFIYLIPESIRGKI